MADQIQFKAASPAQRTVVDMAGYRREFNRAEEPFAFVNETLERKLFANHRHLEIVLGDAPPPTDVTPPTEGGQPEGTQAEGAQSTEVTPPTEGGRAENAQATEVTPPTEVPQTATSANEAPRTAVTFGRRKA